MSAKDITGSEVVADAEQRQYHIALAPGEVASTILLVGDPARAKRVAKLFDTVELERSYREFVTCTGTYKGMRLSVMATGIGPSNVEIAMVELSHVRPPDEPFTLIRVGTCGGLQPEVNVGDLVISTGAVRLEDTSLYFVDPNYPSVADYEVVNALIYSASKLDTSYHVGLTGSGSGFYGAQGRQIPNFPVKDPSIPEQLAERGVKNFEMESSTLFTMATLAGFRAGTVCVVYASRPQGTFVTDDMKEKAERQAIECGLGAAVALAQMDALKHERNQTFWHSGLGLPPS